MDSTSVQALIDKLRDLSASKFVESGFTTPQVEITVVSNDGKRTEKVADRAWNGRQVHRAARRRSRDVRNRSQHHRRTCAGVAADVKEEASKAKPADKKK